MYTLEWYLYNIYPPVHVIIIDHILLMDDIRPTKYVHHIVTKTKETQSFM